MELYCRIVLVSVVLILANVSSLANNAFEYSGKTAFEITAYSSEGQFNEQDYTTSSSIALTSEWYWQWNSAKDSLTFIPFYRKDRRDDERSHADVRELAWTHAVKQWEIHVGIRKVFWGVTEFNHLVDVINQTDLVESPDGEEKLGQAMIHLSKVNPWGVIDGFVLPGFRERTFPGEGGRLRNALVVNADEAAYESSDEEAHVDFALRWSHTFKVYDVGLYGFKGTDREPQLRLRNDELQLSPYYQQITQYGLDLQATIDSWLWKLEAIYKDSNVDSFAASQAGFEYTFYGLRQSSTNLGLLLEYAWDERDTEATTLAQNDIYLGARIVPNDEVDSAFLLGVSYDADYYTRSILLEASRRLSNHWTIALDVLFVVSGNNGDALASLEKDDHIQLIVEHFF